MTNQITEEDRKKIEDMAANFYPFILIEERGILSLSEMDEENDIIEYKRMGFIEGYTLGLQSADGEVDKLYKQRDALLNSKKILEEDNERKDKLLQSAEKRVKELEDGLREIVNYWIGEEPFKDEPVHKEHPEIKGGYWTPSGKLVKAELIYKAKQLLSK